jgi:gliding motility-associated-like protein
MEVFGGTQPYTFSWNNGATTKNASGLFAGIYQLSIEDANGCSLSLDVEINEPEELFIYNIDIEGVVCKDDEKGSIRFNVGGGVAPFTYLWSNGTTNATLTNATGGEYQVIVTDANGCPILYDFYIPYQEDDCELRIPGGLTPGGDGFNDFWVINGLIRFPNNVVQIYNRWGTLVYEAVPYQNDWDGTPNRGRMISDSSGRLPAGTYFYVIVLEPGGKALSGYIYLAK